MSEYLPPLVLMIAELQQTKEGRHCIERACQYSMLICADSGDMDGLARALLVDAYRAHQAMRHDAKLVVSCTHGPDVGNHCRMTCLECGRVVIDGDEDRPPCKECESW